MYKRYCKNIFLLIVLSIFANSAEAQPFKISTESEKRFNQWMYRLHDDFSANKSSFKNSISSYHEYLKEFPDGKHVTSFRKIQKRLIEDKGLEFEQIILSARESFQKGEYFSALQEWEKVVEEIPDYKYLHEASIAAERSQNELKFMSFRKRSIKSEILYGESSAERKMFLKREMTRINQIIREYVNKKYSEGVRELNNGNTLNSYKIFRDIFVLEPKNTNVLSKLAEVATKRGRVNVAKDTLKKGMVTAANQKNHQLFQEFENKLFNLLNIWPKWAIDLVNNNSIIPDSSEAKMASQNWSGLKNKAYDRYYKKEYSEALEFLNKQIDVSLSYFGKDHHYTLIPLKDKAYILGQIGQKKEQNILLNNLLIKFKNIYGEAHPLTISVMKELADKMPFEDSNLLVKYLNILKLERQTYTDLHPQTLITINSIIDYYYFNHKTNEAIHYLDEATILMSKLYGEYPSIMPKHSERLADIHKQKNQVALQKKALQTRLVLLDKIKGRNNYKFSDALIEYSYLFAWDDFSEEKKVILEKALHIQDSLYGIEKGGSFYLLQRLGILYKNKKNYNEAEKLLRRSEESVMKQEKINLAFLESLQSDLSLLYKEQGYLDYAENYQKKSINLQITHPYEKYYSNLENRYTQLGLIQLNKKELRKAEDSFLKAATISENNEGTNNSYLATIFEELAKMYKGEWNLKDTLKYYNKTIIIKENIYGKNHPNLFYTYTGYADALVMDSKKKEAYDYLQKALKIGKKSFGEQSEEVAFVFGRIGVYYMVTGNYSKSLKYHLMNRDLVKSVLGIYNSSYVESLLEIGTMYTKLGEYDNSQNVLDIAYDISVKLFGEYNINPQIIILKANNYTHQSDFERALQYNNKYISLLKAKKGDIMEMFIAYNNKGLTYIRMGLYEKALENFLISHSELVKLHDKNNFGFGFLYNNLGIMYLDMGDHNKAEYNLKKALDIYEGTLGKTHPSTVLPVNNLGLLYMHQNRHELARIYMERSLSILDSQFEHDHPEKVFPLNNLGMIEHNLQNYSNAEKMIKKGIKIAENVLEDDHWILILLLGNLGLVYTDTKRHNDAVKLFERSLIISKKIYGPNSSSYLLTLNNLAFANLEMGNYSKAEEYFKEAYKICLNASNLNLFEAANLMSNYAEFLHRNKTEYEKSLEIFRQSSEIYKNKVFGAENDKNISQRRVYTEKFISHLKLLSDPHFNLVGEFVSSKDYKLFNEGFELSQYSRVSKTSSDLKKMSLRFSTSDTELSDLVREYQNSNKKLIPLQKKLEDSLGLKPEKRNKDDELVIRNNIEGLEKKISETHRIIESRFPKYFQLTQQHSVDIKSIQTILKKNEALISYLSTNSNLFVWAINSKSYIFKSLEITSEELKQKIGDLRKSAITTSTEFDLDKSYELYTKIFNPIESFIKDASHLNIITDRSLQSLPFSILVSKKRPSTSLRSSNLRLGSETRGISGVTKALDKSLDSNEYHTYKNAEWLMNNYSISYFPSIPSFKYLRENKKEKVTTTDMNTFIGFGNPSIGNAFAISKEPEIKKNNFIASLNLRGVSFDKTQLVNLPELPETAKELLSISKILGSSSKSVILGREASETNLKTMDLSKYSIIAFATHGLMANEIKGVDEPSLVLTPPSEPTVIDDGLLTSGEIAQLKLNADWVILSACNTASSDGTPGAEGFSGLTKSFFYAGARSLLVSHWPVASEATVELTTNMFEEMRINPDISKSEALRLSRLKLVNNYKNPEYAHPFFWAPFVVVGEGGTNQLLK